MWIQTANPGMSPWLEILKGDCLFFFPSVPLKTKTKIGIFYYVCLVGKFFFPFIFISWRLITLQYCSGFCHILRWISHGFTCIPPHSPIKSVNPSGFLVHWEWRPPTGSGGRRSLLPIRPHVHSFYNPHL